LSALSTINRTRIDSTSHVTGGLSQSISTKVNNVWTTCNTALGLREGLIRPKVGCMYKRGGSITRNSRDIAQRNSVQETCCYGRVVRLPLLGGQLNYSRGASFLEFDIFYLEGGLEAFGRRDSRNAETIGIRPFVPPQGSFCRVRAPQYRSHRAQQGRWQTP
jgi:hypothetical protein